VWLSRHGKKKHLIHKLSPHSSTRALSDTG
jgi:hypothetical protein